MVNWCRIKGMRSKWWSNKKEMREEKFVEVVKKCENLGKKKEVEVLVELKGEFYIQLGLSLN